MKYSNILKEQIKDLVEQKNISFPEIGEMLNMSNRQVRRIYACAKASVILNPENRKIKEIDNIAYFKPRKYRNYKIVCLIKDNFLWTNIFNLEKKLISSYISDNNKQAIYKAETFINSIAKARTIV